MKEQCKNECFLAEEKTHIYEKDLGACLQITLVRNGWEGWSFRTDNFLEKLQTVFDPPYLCTAIPNAQLRTTKTSKAMLTSE